MINHTRPSILILAAGGSTRLGQSKQLLLHHGKPLIENIISAANEVSNNVYVILGRDFESIKREISSESIHLVRFDDWENGMGSTISFGVQQILNNDPHTQEILIILCDQINVNSQVLKELVHFHRQSDFMITASGYAQSFGVPAIFTRNIFIDLLNLKGESGAKRIIQKHFKDTQVIEFPDVTIDIDTKDDLKYLK